MRVTNRLRVILMKGKGKKVQLIMLMTWMEINVISNQS